MAEKKAMTGDELIEKLDEADKEATAKELDAKETADALADGLHEAAELLVQAEAVASMLGKLLENPKVTQWRSVSKQVRTIRGAALELVAALSDDDLEV